ncbi:MAG: hypothetical protein AB2693_20570 [Candidatus Thiodiazotropha sp.]
MFGEPCETACANMSDETKPTYCASTKEGSEIQPGVSTTAEIEKKCESDLDEADLDKIQAEVKPKVTVYSEVWAMNRFHGNISLESKLS